MPMEIITESHKDHRKLLKNMIKLVDEIKFLSDENAIDLCNKKIDKLVKTATDYCMKTRMLTIFCYDPRYGIAGERLKTLNEEVMKITLEITHEGWFKAVIPALLPKNVGASQWFIREPLNRELQDFFLVYRNTHNGKSFGIECGVIIFKHFYNRNRPQRMNHDLDNYEENGIVDSIAFYILPDDDAKHCFHLHMMEPADTDYTEVHVVPQSQFIYWLMQNGFSNEKPDDTQDFSLKKEKLYSILPPHEENQKAESIPI